VNGLCLCWAVAARPPESSRNRHRFRQSRHRSAGTVVVAAASCVIVTTAAAVIAARHVISAAAAIVIACRVAAAAVIAARNVLARGRRPGVAALVLAEAGRSRVAEGADAIVVLHAELDGAVGVGRTVHGGDQLPLRLGAVLALTLRVQLAPDLVAGRPAAASQLSSMRSGRPSLTISPPAIPGRSSIGLSS